MSITSSLDGWTSVRNIEAAFTGPGTYVLFQGRPRDNRIVYVGKSEKDILLRVNHHQREKEFTHVGIVLPRNTRPVVVHNLEHYMVAEFEDQFGVLPPYNRQRPRLISSARRFNWHNMARRVEDVEFGELSQLRRHELPEGFPRNTPSSGERLRSLLWKLRHFDIDRYMVAEACKVSYETLNAYCCRSELPRRFVGNLREFLQGFR